MPSFTRETWPAEALRRALERVRTSNEGTRHDELLGAAARVADYVAAGDLPRAMVESELLKAAFEQGLTGKREKEARRCIAFGLQKGDKGSAWYPESGTGEPVVRRFRWLNGRIMTLTLSPTSPAIEPTDLPTCPLLRKDTRLTWFSALRDTAGEAAIWSWEEIAEGAAEPMPWPIRGKDDLPLWSWAEYEGDDRGRRPDGLDSDGNERTRECLVSAVHALVLDYDDEETWSLEQVHEWWGGVRYVAHTSAHHLLPKKDAPALPRGRVIIALSRAVTEEEFGQIGKWVLGCGRGQIGQQEIENARRVYYVPARAPGGYEARANLVDAALDVDAILQHRQQVAQAEADQASERAPREAVLQSLHCTLEGAPKATLRNVVEVLAEDDRWSGRLVRCDFSGRDLMDGQALTDAAEVEAACWLSNVYGIDVGVERIHQAMGAVCSRNVVHPVREYLNALQWDGEERLDAWLQYAGCEETDDGLTAIYGRRWCISAVARIYVPGCQVDSALILAGRKGLGKTSTFRTLAGLEWHAESAIAIGDRDGYQQLDGVWIYELGELDSLRRSEISAVKQYITSRVDRYRPSYGRNTIERPRQVVFAGTTNDSSFLPESDRRWWVRQVVRPADLDWLARHRDQLWAEAVHRFRARERWHLEGVERAAQEADVEQFRQVDPWEDLIRGLVGSKQSVTTKELLSELFRTNEKMTPEQALAQAKKSDEMRVSAVLQAWGWQRKKTNGVVRWLSP